MSNEGLTQCCCTPGRFEDPITMTPFPAANLPAAGDQNRFSVLLGDDGNLYVSDGAQWTQVGASGADFSAVAASAKYQAFRLVIRNEGGTIQHFITTPFNGLFSSPFASPGSLANKVNNASSTPTATPIGAIATLTPTNGAMIPNDGLIPGALILDTAAFSNGDWTGTWTIASNTVTTFKTLTPSFIEESINGVSRLRMYIVGKTSTNNTDRWDQLAIGESVAIDYAGFMT